MSKKKGWPDEWGEELWEACQTYGEAEAKYVEICNRFLNAMMELYPDELAELTVGLKQLLLDQDMDPNPEDQLDVYRAWYAKHVKWPKGEARCGVKEWFVDPDGMPLGKPTKTLGKDAEEFVAPTSVRPWFLGAIMELAKHLAKGGYEEVPGPEQGLLADAGIGRKEYSTGEKIEKYVTESGWAVDSLWLEQAPDFWLPNDTRRPDESLRDFINRLLKSFSIIMGLQIAEKAWARPDLRVDPRGRPQETSKKQERMLVRRMFGETIPSIAEAEEDALLDKKKRPVEHPRRAVRTRTDRIAKHLGLKPESDGTK